MPTSLPQLNRNLACAKARLRKNILRFIIVILSIAAVVYFIWQDSNQKLFENFAFIPDDVTRHIYTRV